METHADGMPRVDRQPAIDAAYGDSRSAPQAGDVLASRPTARADIYMIAILPAPTHVTATRHAEAIETVRTLARERHVDGWFTCNHTHYTRVANFRDRSGHRTGRVDDK
jgi:hypothetical protein